MRLKSKGFTLIEIIIVIAIIGVLISIAVPSYLSSVQGAMDREIEMNARAIVAEIHGHYASRLKNPTDAQIDDIIEALKINKTDIEYKASVEEYGIKIEYSSTVKKYAGIIGYRNEPTSASDIADPSNLNDGTSISKVWFVFPIGKI